MLARSSRALARMARGVMAATKAPTMAGCDLDAQALRSRTWSRKTSAAWTCGMCASPNVAVAQLQNASLPRETVPDDQGEPFEWIRGSNASRQTVQRTCASAFE